METELNRKVHNIIICTITVYNALYTSVRMNCNWLSTFLLLYVNATKKIVA